MAAPQIPNLLSMRGRGVGRGRGRGRGLGSSGETSTKGEDSNATATKHDQIIQQTDTDANLSRLSAVQAGYLSDPFAAELAPLEPGSSRRLPIINRGTYARTRAIDRLVDEFLAAKPEVRKQIVSLGAGSDTRFFRLMGSGKEPVPDVLYHELDFPSNTAQKLWVIGKSAVLKQLLGNEDQIVWAADELHAPNYHLHPVDLRTLHPTDGSSAGPRSLPHIDAGLPTLLLSECCLTYLKPDAADAVVKYFGQTILKPETPLGLALYEPVNPFDAFGKVMISNLATRGIVLQTVNKYSSLGAQKARLKTYELDDGQRAVDANFLHQRWIDEAEKERINELEMLDEVEELQMLMSHYCVAWGWRNGSDPGVWEKWREIEDQPSDT